jgi:tRNA 2-selenouridine synthase
MVELKRLSDLAASRHDAIIDVRSPGEFAEDHVPGAINLPVLDDAERARVGTIYKQVSPFDARKIGAALVFRNAATHIETALAEKPGGWRPLVYCWRGGQRSGAFAWMLGQIGWPAETIKGGYRSFRRAVVRTLYDEDLSVRLIRLGGHTGTGKTALLDRLQARGVQVIDLEALAGHRGSLLGAMSQPQPSQKSFETRLAMGLGTLDPARPVVVEAESSKIGALILPPALWKAMKAAPLFEVTAPLDARAGYLAEAYRDVLDDEAGLRRKLAPLRRHRGHELVDHWTLLIDRGDRLALCRSLAETHYDPAYVKAARATGVRPSRHFATPSLSEDALDRLAAEIEEAVQTISI